MNAYCDHLIEKIADFVPKEEEIKKEDNQLENEEQTEGNKESE